MSEFDPVGAQVVLVPKKMAVDERVELGDGDRLLPQCILDRIAVAKPVLGDEVLLDETANAVRLIREAGPVEVGNDCVLAPFE